MSTHLTKSRRLSIAPLLFAIAVGGCCSFVQFAAPTVACAQEAQSGVLLLKTPKNLESVVSGQLSLKGDTYEVVAAEDSRVWIPRDRVLFVGRDILDAYEFKRNGIVSWSVGDHYQLTRWCLINQLLEQATEHYTEVAKLAPGHRRVSQLSVELQKKLLEDGEFRDYLGLPPLIAASSNQFAPQPVPGESVIAASGSDVAPIRPEVSLWFSQKVQPILINRCSQSGCHGSASHNGLRLLEPYAKSYARLSTANLLSVRNYLGTDANSAAPLVSYAINAHGQQRAPGIGFNEQELVHELQSWIAFARSPVMPALATSTTTEGAQTAAYQAPTTAPPSDWTPVRPGNSQLQMVPLQANPEADGSQVAGFSAQDQPPTMDEIDALDHKLRQMLGESPAPASARSTAPPTRESIDPFDPAEFNRRVLERQLPQ
ncbi:hypothetical protein [Aureliella helgolandensis]|uniref:Cytochrome c domain-containing protein n=1 Tax=Aureliella helgolandensis TaxID=2527968 RepID=A0A518GE64_9BACT|nr:hypothetical protein [Aureliella helgolandensis]QDV26894.1 hypothetical protein Q31a_52730 [Aureliella helgolandensis]